LPESASNSFAQPEPASKSHNKHNPAHTTSDEDGYATPTLDLENDPGEPGDEEDQSPEPEPKPDIPLYTECPIMTFHEGGCKDIDVVPTHPTKALVRLLKDAQHSRSCDPWSSHTLRLKMACCIQISKEIIGQQQAVDGGWPTDVDFSSLTLRLEEIKSLLAGTVEWESDGVMWKHMEKLFSVEKLTTSVILQNKALAMHALG
jgi:hypothetical protein